jgi:protein-tyrosine phosphatase
MTSTHESVSQITFGQVGKGRLGKLVQASGMDWCWLPVLNGKFPAADVQQRLLEALLMFSRLLDDGKSLLIHCSAGIHRTGTVAYGLLRWRGLDQAQAMRLIGSIRRETAEGMLEKRMRWGDEIARQTPLQDPLWISFVKEFVNRFKMKLFKPP